MVKKTQNPAVRVRMAPEARRDAILDAAQRLFATRGWENVTIADVQTEAEISRGGFYHHFSAKEDLLTGIISRLSASAMQTTGKADAPQMKNALMELNSFLADAARWTADNAEELRGFVQIFSRPGNEILYQRICAAEAAEVKPVLKRIIERGHTERTFKVVDTDLTADLMLGLAQGRRETLIEVFELTARGDFEAATRRLDLRLCAEGAIFDRLLGLPEGSVVLSNPKEYRRMLSRLADAG